VSHFVQRALARRTYENRRDVEQRGLLLASGLITGEALVGIGLAVPIVASGRSDVLAFWGTHEAAWPGALLMLALVALLYRLSAPRRG
jgi:hypothetical protein